MQSTIISSKEIAGFNTWSPGFYCNTSQSIRDKVLRQTDTECRKELITLLQPLWSNDIISSAVYRNLRKRDADDYFRKQLNNLVGDGKRTINPKVSSHSIRQLLVWLLELDIQAIIRQESETLGRQKSELDRWI